MRVKWKRGVVARWRAKTSSRGAVYDLTSPPLPPALELLVTSGAWDEAMRRNWSAEPLVGRLRAILPQENELHLLQAPFQTVAQAIAQRPPEPEPFYETYWALSQIQPDLVLIIADFEIGADTALVLDYGLDPVDPPVRYLQWNPPGPAHNSWVTVAPNVEALAQQLGIGT